MTKPLDHIRNFAIIAHIDHGNPTLADRLIQTCDELEDREMSEQVLDNFNLSMMEFPDSDRFHALNTTSLKAMAVSKYTHANIMSTRVKQAPKQTL